MEIFIVDAFTTQQFSGNQAGVVLLGQEDFPTDQFCCSLAGELKHSETVFVRTLGENSFHMRYFTPAGEVDLCGHATVAAFTVLREQSLLSAPTCQLTTNAGALSITLDGGWVWMDMAPPKVLHVFTPEESVPLYQAYGLTPEQGISGLSPKLVSTGLADILLPVQSAQVLSASVQNREQVVALSHQYEAVGFHLFSLEEDCTARCRNFAPRYDIDEESATGTANGALTYYLYEYNKLSMGEEALFLQGASMGKPSQIKSRITQTSQGIQVKIGGCGVISLTCTLAPK